MYKWLTGNDERCMALEHVSSYNLQLCSSVTLFIRPSSIHVVLHLCLFVVVAEIAVVSNGTLVMLKRTNLF